MQATIKQFSNGEWRTAYQITTDPLAVTDSEGKLLNQDQLTEWAENQAPAIFEGKRHTPLSNPESWLRGLHARKYTYLSVQISE